MAFLDRPRELYPTHGMNRPLDLSLTTEDIDGAQTRKRSFTTNRCTDPLDPVYKLPSFKLSPIPTVPQPINTIPTNYIADIDGARPRPLHRVVEGKPSNLDISDIEFSQPRPHCLKPRCMNSNTCVDSLNVRDINDGSSRPARSRSVNPLEPVYKISNLSNWSPNDRIEPSMIGPIEKGKPRTLIPTAPLITRGDITGSHPQRFVGRLKHNSVGEPLTQLWERPLPTASTHGSHKKGISTKRMTDPLDPSYLMLDGEFDSACKKFMQYY